MITGKPTKCIHDCGLWEPLAKPYPTCMFKAFFSNFALSMAKYFEDLVKWEQTEKEMGRVKPSDNKDVV